MTYHCMLATAPAPLEGSLILPEPEPAAPSSTPSSSDCSTANALLSSPCNARNLAASMVSETTLALVAGSRHPSNSTAGAVPPAAAVAPASRSVPPELDPSAPDSTPAASARNPEPEMLAASRCSRSRSPAVEAPAWLRVAAGEAASTARSAGGAGGAEPIA